MLTDEQIVAHWNKHQDPLALGRFVEAAARRDALEAAAKVCEKYGTSVTTKDCAAAIRKLKEDIQ